jgi:hypothetical protein
MTSCLIFVYIIYQIIEWLIYSVPERWSTRRAGSVLLLQQVRDSGRGADGEAGRRRVRATYRR